MKKKEKPILFKTEMIQAILDGRKTQTRRTKGFEKVNKAPNEWAWENRKKQEDVMFWNGDIEDDPNPLRTYFILKNIKTSEELAIQSPYRPLQDILYIRETYGIEKRKTKRIVYKAGDKAGNVFPVEKWIPSIFMPKKAARIWLKITDIYPERLRDISKNDAINEGIKRIPDPENFQVWIYYFYPCNDLRDDTYLDNPLTSFYSLWRSINGDESWQANPWVWRIEFEVISTNGKPTTDN